MFAADQGSTPNGKLWVDDCFSCYLYTGNGSTQTINNGIDLAGKGGLVWIKGRDTAMSHILRDSVRGNFRLSSDLTDGQGSVSSISFTSSGYSLTGGYALINDVNKSYVSWTFRKAPKFFDVVTYTGDGVAGRQITHSLGVAPGMIIVKCTNAVSDWVVYHNSLFSASYSIRLNQTYGESFSSTFWNSTAPTETVFSVGDDALVNQSGSTYVAYIFAHDSGVDGIIRCGRYDGTSNAVGPIINLGWEPQYLLIKKISSGGNNWQIIDAMRGMPVGSADATLQANLGNAESSVDYISPTATGFQVTSTSSEVNASGQTYIYLAIRRPNKPPTTGTQVFYIDATTASTGAVTTTNFPVDLQIGKWRTGSDYGQDWSFIDRLRGLNTIGAATYVSSLRSTNVNAEAASLLGFNFDNLSYKLGSYYDGMPKVFYSFRRAPGFMDVVCYTGTGVARTVPHSLGVPPELMIVKVRSTEASWSVYVAPLGATKWLILQTDNAVVTDTNWNNTAPTSSVFTVGIGTDPNRTNASNKNYVAYLFASLPGISKVGSYTGNGPSQMINCGFTTGARFILIKRTDSTGDWYVWDSARGIAAANDPHLSLNTAAAEVTTDDSVDPDASGFIVNQVAATNINVSGGSYIFLAVA